MAEPKLNNGGTVVSDAPATAGGGTMIASSSDAPKLPPKAPPKPPPGGGSRTVVASAPPSVPPAVKPPPLGGSRTVVASAPKPAAATGGGTQIASEAAAPPSIGPDLSGGGTMIASNTSPPSQAAVAVAVSQAPGDLVGHTLLGRYTVLKKLGEGGMGTVYLGEHATIGKKFAVKVLSHEFAHKDDLRERFLQEARAASMISQENVVEITDFGDTPNGSVFFIMEFLKGEDLSDTVKSEGRLPWARVQPIMMQICRALGAAHDAGIIHRDMKPENCYRITRGKNADFIKVLDFGIAKVTSEDDGEGKGLTRTGMIFGTPEYMSPEQAQGSKPDHRVDVYATGVIMYELLTGRVPFTADTFMGILTKHMFEVPEAPSSVVPEADIPIEVEAIILKAMQKDRELRFKDMAEMAEAIDAVGTGAGAVSFVNENIARPSTGEMAFTGVRQTAMPGTIGTVPPVTADYQEPTKRNNVLIGAMLIGTVAVAAIIGGVMIFAPKDNDRADAVAENANATEATVAKPEPEPEPEIAVPVEVEEPEVIKEIQAGVETVNFHITTRDPDGNLVEARIHDSVDNALYGTTNTDAGVDVAKSTDPIEITLKAKGFEDMKFKIVPIRDKPFEHVLEPEKKATTTIKKPPIKKADPKPEPKADPKPEPKPDPKPEKPPRRVAPDLKDPFNARGG